MARAHDSMEMAVFLEEFADWIERHLEEWTVTNEGVLLPGGQAALHAHPAAGEGRAYACEDCGDEMIHINNRPPGDAHRI